MPLRFWKREWVFWFAALAALSGAAGLAWLTQNPTSPVLDRTSDWPVVGWMSRAFRARYLPSKTSASGPHDELEQGRGFASRRSPRLGVLPRIWITQSTVAYAEPSVDAERLTVLDPIVSAVQRERQGDWYGLDLGGRVGWVHLPNYSETSDPPLGSAPAPILPVPDLEADSERLQMALRGLDGGGRKDTLGDYVLFTDSSDPELMPRLRRTVSSLERVYSERYGVTPIDRARASLVIFSLKAEYLRFKGLDSSLVDREASGHVGKGIVALYRQGRTADEVRSTLLHELVHLLNRRALGPALPVWLDEGVAEDLSGSAVGVDGALLPGTLASTTVFDDSGWVATGAEASLVLLRRRLQDEGLLRLEDLIVKGDEQFHDRENRTLHYALSGFWVRFLMQRYSAQFKGFLEAISLGEPATTESLKNHLQMEWKGLDLEFAEWLRTL